MRNGIVIVGLVNSDLDFVFAIFLFLVFLVYLASLIKIILWSSEIESSTSFEADSPQQPQKSKGTVRKLETEKANITYRGTTEETNIVPRGTMELRVDNAAVAQSSEPFSIEQWIRDVTQRNSQGGAGKQLEKPTKEQLAALKQQLGIAKGSVQFKDGSIYLVTSNRETKKHMWKKLGRWADWASSLTEPRT